MNILINYSKNIIFLLVLLFSYSLKANDMMKPISTSKINVGGEIGRRIDITINNNLLAVDIDNDFLKPFRQKKDDDGYVGLGKTIDAAVRLAIYSGDDNVIKLKQHLVDETIKAQLNDGYPGKLKSDKRMWVFWDIHEMSYIIYGLVSDYIFFNEKKSLQAAQKAADYIINHWSDMPKNWPENTQRIMPTTGIDRAFLALSKATGNNRYQNFLINQLDLTDWDLDIVEGRSKGFKGHAYVFMAVALAQAELYRELGDEKLLSQANKVIDFITKQDGLLINGAVGYQECWHSSQIGFFKLGETCATAYLIRTLDNLLRLNGNSLYGDLMERSIYNALFAAQSPDGRKLRYYVPFEGERIYFDLDTYCCPCNFRRIIAELPGMVYYQSEGGVAVNLYTESRADFNLGNNINLTIKQETDYPNSGESVFTLTQNKSVQFPLKFRIPRWCDQGAQLTVNNEPVLKNITSGSFLTVDRIWNSGDIIKLELPMTWRIVNGRKAQSGKAAVMRGPVLFTLNPALNKNISPENIRLLRIDPESITGPFSDSTLRPNGMACRVKAWDPNEYSSTPNLELLLTEFPDPDGLSSYFILPDPKSKVLVDDELLVK